MGTRQRIGIAVAFAAAATVVVTARVLIDSASALRQGDEAASRGDRGAALSRYLEAARLYAPGSPYVRRAMDRLDEMADAAQRAGDLETARSALEAMRASALGARSFHTPHAGRLPEVERRLAAVQAALDGSPSVGREAWHRERLSRHPGPALGYSILALAGFLTWVGAAVAFIVRGLDPSAVVRRRPAAVCAAVFVVGFALFVVGLRLA